MGCFYELNDTLLLTAAQGFPSDVLDIKGHQKKPVTAADLAGRVFSFDGLTAARAFQLDPVRVFLFEHTEDDKWLAWGKVFIQSLTIARRPDLPPTDPVGPIRYEIGDWTTSGTYRIVEIYDPEMQKTITRWDSPAKWSYFPSA
jgi:hypothetical protein